ncbi:hypothetical protein BKA57DRAFT_520683 [Linnemannia elongata]|nr:hypothetical protein BKA57DRAFT_520683 [Linnemannia elongata]
MVAYFKEVIRTEKATEFDDIAAVKLTLWTVSILDDDGDDGLPILISSVSEKRIRSRRSHGLPKQPRAKLVCDNEDLRKILKVAKTALKTTLTISLEIPIKNIFAWSFKDVYDVYDLSASSDSGLRYFRHFPTVDGRNIGTRQLREEIGFITQ